LAANEENANLISATLLAGANLLMLANDNGEVSQWFEVNTDDDGRQFAKIRAFETEKTNKLDIYTEYYRRTFFTTTANGDLGVYYTTSEAELWRGKISEQAIDAFAVSPRANAVLSLSNNTLSVFEVHNEHPEVTWSALWNEVWYEGYPEPAYTWQSTSASDDFESKFSLVPISFGTIKAAMYAMLFAVPIAISAAIYTAYFMSSELRRVVKPTVEIMEALPTVILGFLAGLWLAPLIEEHLPAVIALITLLPLAVIATAFGWTKLPASIRHLVPDGWQSILLIPVVLLIGWFSFAISGQIELWVFDGNVRQYLTNELGLTFDQRNSLVVGIAMGFAVIPTIFSIAEDAVFSVPKHLSNGSLALGATQWQTLVYVVLLTASPGIFSAVMMGLGRAVGETMIVLMATGNTPIMDWSIFQGMRTLAANIAVEMPESEVGSSHYRILFLAAFVLFIFTFIFNTVAEFVRQRLREKYSSM
jgi:phosphate transport system permease protein